jgi:hypothetical protein
MTWRGWVILAAIAAAGAGGWVLNGWRLAGELERRAGVIETQHQALETLKGANDRCAAGVADVRKSLAAFYADVDARSARVEAALEEAERAAQAHQEAARAALGRPMPKAGEECASVAGEAAAYAAKRKGAPEP